MNVLAETRATAEVVMNYDRFGLLCLSSGRKENLLGDGKSLTMEGNPSIWLLEDEKGLSLKADGPVPLGHGYERSQREETTYWTDMAAFYTQTKQTRRTVSC
jgi:hypothetical protein